MDMQFLLKKPLSVLQLYRYVISTKIYNKEYIINPHLDHFSHMFIGMSHGLMQNTLVK